MWVAIQIHCYLVTVDCASKGRRRAELSRESERRGLPLSMLSYGCQPSVGTFLLQFSCTDMIFHESVLMIKGTVCVCAELKQAIKSLVSLRKNFLSILVDNQITV